ncbi:RagB/SusD family nutrient uptake outer membrane protein [Tamlana fucoidanivorans]|uniref:RagB/SusD family nutrient uptake outer membrane protein n=1 Tax=Allotamlana fucoidanivorans TaxID=2583814 RepID=A0A5C4SIW9_9FLAO|nr:RagB/SusD family nutrient uptake outer membrane protein [Tamlana fucoidanivorans]TNJ43770.1 RagB/SusD family nutrient uptake outer membrane protein [Tamlana fucoidanivorans]
MKIFIKKLTVLLLSTTFLVGCEKSFLEDPVPTSSVSDVVIFGSRAGAEALLSGIQRNFRRQFTRTDAGGVYSLYMARTVKGNDFIQNSWYNFDYDNDNREPNYTRTTFNWEYPYYMINQANTLINGVEASTAISGSDKTELIAQGKALRAFFYFQLAMEFQHTYTYDPSLPAPPIYTDLSLEGKPMSTLQEMYDLIISDLTDAVAGLDDSRLGKSYVNKQVANGILARVYLVTENWAGAEKAAHDAYGGDIASALDAGSYKDGFDKISNIEWIWGMPQTTDQSNYYYCAPHAFTDHYNDGYFGTYVNKDFADLFTDSDVRNTFDRTYASASPTDWFYLTTRKFTFAFDSDIVIMRTAEMILIEAEAKFKQGMAGDAHELLFALQSNRDANAVKSTNTGDDLYEEILVERRKELYAEFGVEWFDAKRLRRGIPRTGNHRLPNSFLLPDDKKFFLKVPRKEIDANVNIDDSVNADR